MSHLSGTFQRLVNTLKSWIHRDQNAIDQALAGLRELTAQEARLLRSSNTQRDHNQEHTP